MFSQLLGLFVQVASFRQAEVADEEEKKRKSKCMGKVERKDGLKSSVITKKENILKHMDCKLKIAHEEVK